ncbi:universal stress protein [Actinomycetospora cinnamomea]|uniref:Nucleotide-binding universal stress UspA family protein n=1 Tax=Actinomycetospora cinnamomea TaxID=663609 RepID=A0A2U1F2R4_9PSEU|nr:universal stress protein [Actinomycetospora cinnamomea]PVZ06310.1 nucleotide-binding universal stress UspA family protein [Actinomycetospora cinnamomea]
MTDQRPVVLVGVDGSTDADAALRYAVEEARRRGGRVLAIAAAEPPAIGALDVESMPVNPEAVRQRTARGTREHVDEVLAGVEGDRVSVEVRARLGRPTSVLVHAARDADLLVVGHRGRGPVASALLGSVGLGCVLHAPCPVTVVRARPTAASVLQDRAATAAAP